MLLACESCKQPIHANAHARSVDYIQLKKILFHCKNRLNIFMGQKQYTYWNIKSQLEWKRIYWNSNELILVVFFKTSWGFFCICTKRLYDQAQREPSPAKISRWCIPVLPWQCCTLFWCAFLNDIVFSNSLQKFCLCRKTNTTLPPKTQITIHTVKNKNPSIILSSASFHLLFKKIRRNKEHLLRALQCRKNFSQEKMIILGTAWLQQTKALETSKIKKEVPRPQEYSHEKLHL